MIPAQTGAALGLRALQRKDFALPVLIRPRQVMASPPTVTFGTSTAGGTLTQQFRSGTHSASWPMPSMQTRGLFNYARTQVGRASGGGVATGSNGVNGDVLTATTNLSVQAPAMFQASFEHYGEMVEIILSQTGTEVMVRVDDEYISLTPQALGSTGGGINYLKLAFGSRSYRRIDVIGANSFSFRGAYAEPGDIVLPAAIRGPRTMFVGDSFSQPGLQVHHAYFADAMGWDDVWSAGVGGTGWDSNNAGNSLRFGARIATDVIPYSPDIVWLYGSVNDGAKVPATCATNAAAATAAIKAALPDCLVIGGYNAVGGVETMTANMLDVMDAVQAAIVGAGGIWLSPVELPLEYGGTVPNTTLASTHSAGRLGANPDTAPYTTATNLTGLYCPGVAGTPDNLLRLGATVEIGTGATRERVVITGFSQITGTHVSWAFQGALQYTHSAGETVTEVNPSYMRGTGQLTATTGWGNADTLVSADNVHPSPEGQQMIGLVNAQLLRDWLARRTAAERIRFADFAV